ncbi:B-cell receptor CD22-like [Oreochromis aureus]|uniref:B-cell receptor CD22-like n=1 Tax=Oreochromis aureus TaxID=47969 RepID=UPI000393D9F6|nr:B-cell receptor CD22-like [Oreochromis aureus]
MSLTGVMGRFVVALLSVSVVQSQTEYGVTYTVTHIYAVKGSTVDIQCTYTYPPRKNNQSTEVQKRLWYTKWNKNVPVDLITDPNYRDRVKYCFHGNNCTLRITDLRESDSAKYMFRFETNQPGGRFSGLNGVILCITDAPKLLSVSVSPSAEIVEGSSVTLTCSSDANPAAKYTWYKENGHATLSEEQTLFFRSIQSSDSGQYYCITVKSLELKCSGYKFIDVKYAPKLPSVSVSPSAEIVEGSSVTLTCSSDANPEAKYTWYKEGEDSPKTSGHNFTISNIGAEHSGSYYCVAHNNRGTHNSTLQLTVVAGAWKVTAAGVTFAVLLSIIALSVFLWIWKRRSSKELSQPGNRAGNREQKQPQDQEDLQYASIHFPQIQADPLYSSIRGTQSHIHMKEQEVTEYTAVRFKRDDGALR